MVRTGKSETFRIVVKGSEWDESDPCSDRTYPQAMDLLTEQCGFISKRKWTIGNTRFVPRQYNYITPTFEV